MMSFRARAVSFHRYSFNTSLTETPAPLTPLSYLSLKFCQSEDSGLTEMNMMTFKTFFSEPANTSVCVRRLYLVCSRDLELSVGDGEAAAELLGGDVGAVLHGHVLLDGSHQTPELLLHQLCGHHLSGAQENKSVRHWQ